MQEKQTMEKNFRERVAVLQKGAEPKKSGRMETLAKKANMTPVALAVLVAALTLVLLAAIALTGISIHYRSVFLPGTVINGYDCGGVSADAAAEFLLGTARGRSALLHDAEGDAITALPLESFVEAEDFTAAVREYFAVQHAESGFFGWMTPGDRTLDTPVYAVSDADAASKILSRTLYDETPRTEPVNARIVPGEDGYTIDPGAKGNLVNLASCVSALAEQLPTLCDLRGADPAVSVQGGVIRQKIAPDSPALLRQQEMLEEYLSTEITLEFPGGGTYTLTSADIWRMSEFDFSGGEAEGTPVWESVRALADTIADEYALDGVYAKFRNAEKTRPYIYYRVGDTGWILDRDALADDIVSALETGTDTTVTPRYDTTWYWKEQYWYYNVGDTFLEISLDNQYMWYYVDGEVLVETPVVTGNIAARDYTRTGCFRIASMTTDTYLVGPTWNDHVEYWMPFDDQIGLHDSSWRSEYGGDIYLTDGSHGCVNTPLDAIATIYDNISVGTIVIVY